MSMNPITLTSSLIADHLPKDVSRSKSWASDFDTCTEIGVYDVNETTKNFPLGGKVYGSLFVFSGGYFRQQLFFSTAVGVWSRTFTVSNTKTSFHEWQRFVTESVS